MGDPEYLVGNITSNNSDANALFPHIMITARRGGGRNRKYSKSS